jgi:hypothetical protein
VEAPLPRRLRHCRVESPEDPPGDFVGRKAVTTTALHAEPSFPISRRNA